jgi:septal ring factor EnvC (AmiA/AmiB activator)
MFTSFSIFFRHRGCMLQLQQNCSALEEALAGTADDRESLQQQLQQSQDSLDAVAGELQAQITRADAAEAAVEQLNNELQAAHQEQHSMFQEVLQ